MSLTIVSSNYGLTFMSILNVQYNKMYSALSTHSRRVDPCGLYIVLLISFYNNHVTMKGPWIYKARRGKVHVSDIRDC